MKALIYTRTSSCEELAKNLIESCKIFCRNNQIEIKASYFDIGIKPSASKTKFKGFSELLKNLEEDDCIVCDRFLDLPAYFRKDIPSIPIIIATEKPPAITTPRDFQGERNSVIARMLVDTCIRNVMEEFHAGKSPKTQTGDYSDVKVVFPGGEIPWTEVSHISDKEMRKLMLELEQNVIRLLSLLHGDKLSFEKITGLSNTFFMQLYHFGYPKNRQAIEILNNPSFVREMYSDLFENCGVSWDDPKWSERQYLMLSGSSVGLEGNFQEE